MAHPVVLRPRANTNTPSPRTPTGHSWPPEGLARDRRRTHSPPGSLLRGLDRWPSPCSAVVDGSSELAPLRAKQHSAKVVELRGDQVAPDAGTPWRQNALAANASTTKAMATCSALMLVDHAEPDLDRTGNALSAGVRGAEQAGDHRALGVGPPPRWRGRTGPLPEDVRRPGGGRTGVRGDRFGPRAVGTGHRARGTTTSLSDTFSAESSSRPRRSRSPQYRLLHRPARQRILAARQTHTARPRRRGGTRFAGSRPGRTLGRTADAPVLTATARPDVNGANWRKAHSARCPHRGADEFDSTGALHQAKLDSAYRADPPPAQQTFVAGVLLDRTHQRIWRRSHGFRPCGSSGVRPSGTARACDRSGTEGRGWNRKRPDGRRVARPLPCCLSRVVAGWRETVGPCSGPSRSAMSASRPRCSCQRRSRSSLANPGEAASCGSGSSTTTAIMGS